MYTIKHNISSKNIYFTWKDSLILENIKNLESIDHSNSAHQCSWSQSQWSRGYYTLKWV